MKINGEFIMREVTGDYLLVPVGRTSIDFNGMIVLSETGAIVWNIICSGGSIDKAVNAILDEYEIDEQTVRKDVADVISKLAEGGIVSY